MKTNNFTDVKHKIFKNMRTKNIEEWYLDILNLAAKKSPNGINDPEIRKCLKYPELQTAFVEKYGLEYTITPTP